jgi:hypothetical protein
MPNRYSLASRPCAMGASQPSRQAQQRVPISLSLPREQLAWLDQTSAGVMSRASLIRLLIDRAMSQPSPSPEAR